MIALSPPFLANDMEELYNSVISGVFQPIPKNFSHSLKLLVKRLLKVNPNLRPNCNEILEYGILEEK